MLPSNLTDPVYTDPGKAREFLETLRWADGVVCPHCGVIDEATKLAGKKHRAPASTSAAPVRSSSPSL
jgi:hypothetical protein